LPLADGIAKSFPVHSEQLARVLPVTELVDFAHTEAAAGEGPDEGVLLGMDTTLTLLDGRIVQIKYS